MAPACAREKQSRLSITSCSRTPRALSLAFVTASTVLRHLTAYWLGVTTGLDVLSTPGVA